MSTLESINTFLASEKIAVAGVSRKKQKFGNSIYKELTAKGYEVYPVNPQMDEFQGKKCFHSLAELPKDVKSLVINTKSDTTLKLIQEAKENGIKNIWLQQGSAHSKSLKTLEDPELNIVSRECILMYAGEVKGIHGFHRWLKKSFGTFPS